MKSSFWTPYISDHTVNAICWTLIHSLWIGLVIALLSGLVITITRKSGAALRYNLLCGILVLFTVSVYVTFCIEMWTPAIAQGPFHVGQVVYAPDNHIIIIPSTTTPHLSLLSRIVVLLNEYANIIFLAWLLLFVLKSLKMAGGLLYIQRIRNYKIHEVSEEFKHKIGVFAAQIGISQTVRLVQSELVKVPVAVGWLKPMILLPMGILLQLSPEQLEGILWHELAHIRRRDYLVNILQGLVETVFFFNPGLLWLSSLIRAEREACCDDMVLSRMSRKANYLEALLAFGNADNSRTNLAMSIGSGDQLRHRLKRMVSRENRKLGVAEKVVLVAGLIALSAFTSLPKTTGLAMKHLMHVITKKDAAPVTQKPVVSKPLIKIQPVIRSRRPGVDTIAVKKDTAIHFTSVLFNKSDADLANSEISGKDDKGNIYHLVVVDNKLTALDINNIKVDQAQLPAYQYLVKEIDRQIGEKRRFMMTDIAGFKAMSPRAKFGDKGWTDTFAKKRLRLGWKKSDSLWLKKGSMKPMPGSMKSGLMRQRMKEDSSNYAAEQARAHGVIADLVAEKVVPNASAVKWFGLSDTEFIVNGQKQPEALQQKFKAKYGVHENYGLYYGPAEMTGTGVFINDDAHVNFQKHSFGQLKLKQQQFMEQDKQFKPLPKKLWLQKDDLFMQQRDLARSDAQQKHFFRPTIPLNDIIADVTSDLVSENIIKGKNELSSFKLTNTFLTVNGKKQPDEIHDKLKSKYLTEPRYSLDRQAAADPRFGIHYSKNGSMGIGIEVDRDDP